MTTAPEAGATDPETVRTFCRMLHEAAAHALQGASDPGMLQLDFLHPNSGGGMHSARFAIGAVDAMADSAISAAEDGLNVYVEGRTVDVRRGRGAAGATRGVFALINDSDADKGRAGTLQLQPTWRVESSPGNAHNWILLDRALTPDEAEPLGRALRAFIGSDSATGKPTQPYRVAGTPNYPDAKKRARGRVTSPTRILSADGPIWSAAELVKIVPPAPERPAGTVPGGRSGATSDTVEALAAEAGPDRSERFFATVRAAIRAGMLPGDLEDVFRRHPGGCAGKYLQPDRLAAEIARAWAKVAAKAEEEAEATAGGVDPTYPDVSVAVDEARAALQAAIEAHFAAKSGYRAIQTSTGTGKTRAAARAIAADIRRRRGEGDRRAILYLVPTHRLGDEVSDLFKAEGVTACVFRGRGADDPDRPGTGHKMCLDMEAVEMALALGLTISTACCKGKSATTGTTYYCSSYSECSYQRQIAKTPDVWIGAHDLLFSAPAGLGEIGSVVVDEAFWATGVRVSRRGLTLEEVGAAPAVGRNPFEMLEAADVAAWRVSLRTALQRQESLGGIARRHLVAEGIDAGLCARANALEWSLRGRIHFWPGMDKAARKAAAVAAQASGRISKVSAVWRAARDLLEQEDEDAVSGRLVLVEVDTEDGFGKTRGVLTHGIRKVLDRWLDLPILVMDATLPDFAVLQRFLPGIEAKAPHAKVRQVLGAPVSRSKLLDSKAGRNRDAMRRAILHRFVEAGRPDTLVICQLEMEEWLRSAGLPDRIALAHFNAISGLDVFRDVGLLIVIGRTLPNVLEVETLAGAITGLDPLRTPEPAKGPRWYDKAKLGIRMADGTGYAVDGDRHPDPIAEAVRWQACEAGLIQAIGRARAVNRTARTPVLIDIMNDLVLPLAVDEIVPWEKVPAGYEADMIADGMVLESPSDMAACWPKVWETAQAARRWQQKSTGAPNPIEDIPYKGWGACAPLSGPPPRPAPFRYQHAGERQKWRRGWYLPDIVVEPCAWLESRLGVTLAGFEYLPDAEPDVSEEPAAGETADHSEDERSAA